MFRRSSAVLRAARLARPRRAARRAFAARRRTEFPFLKESVESRASRRIFLRSFYDKACSRFFWNSNWVEESVVVWVDRGLVLRGCSRRSFRGRRHPNPFLREYPPALRQSSRSAGNLTPIILCDRLADAGRLNQRNARQVTPSPLEISDWPWRPRGLLLCERRRADANRTATTFFLRLLLTGFVAHRWGSIMTVLGEAEVGSAGTQPTKE